MASKIERGPSPMDGKNHMEVFYALIAAGAQGIHGKPSPKVKKS